MKTRILFTIPNFITAGSGGAMLSIVRRLDRDRFEPAICISRTGGRLEREVERLGIPLLEAPFTVPAQPYATLPARAWKAARTFRPHAFHIWHSFHYSDDYTEPLIARLSGARHWIYTKKNMSWRRRSWHIRSLLATRIAALNSDMLRDFFAGPLYRYKTRLLPRGVDTTVFRPGLAPRLGVRERLGLADRVVVCNVAHLLPVKGQRLLIEAVAQLPDVALLLVGAPVDAVYATSLRERAAHLGVSDRVHFLGGIDDVPALLAEIDVFCLPTLARGRGEGFGVSLLEAMACGCACVASDIHGPRDMIEHARSGWLVAAEDLDALSAALKQLVGDRALRARLGRAARERVERCYTIEREVAKHTALYEELRGIARP